MRARRFWVLLLTLWTARCAVAEIRLRLKVLSPSARQEEEGQSEFRKRRPFSRPHILFEYSNLPQVSDVLELTLYGADVVRYIPDAAVLVAADPASVPSIPGARMRQIEPYEKLSPDLAAAARAFLIDFHPDVPSYEAEEIVRQEGLESRYHPDLLPNQLLVFGAAESVKELAQWDEVAYVYPASPDLVEGTRVHACAGAMTAFGAIAQAVATVGDGWDGPGRGSATLGYFFGTLASRLPRAAAQTEIVRALNAWSQAADLTFVPASSAADLRSISILFAARAHGDGYPFDGPGRVIGHTFYPAPPNPETVAGDMHFDDDEDWAVDDDVDVFSVALHELGHALGLGHSDRPGTVMYPYYRRVTGLTETDIAAVRELYAARPGPEPPEAPADPPSKPSDDPPAGPPSTPDPPANPSNPQTPNTPPSNPPQPGNPGGPSTPSNPSNPSNPGNPSNPQTPSTPPKNPATPPPAPPANDTVPPVLTLLSPGSNNVLTYDATIRFRGMASDNLGVTKVTWEDSIGNSGAAIGTAFWQTLEIPLRIGANTLTVRAYDAANNMAWRTVVVTRKGR